MLWNTGAQLGAHIREDMLQDLQEMEPYWKRVIGGGVLEFYSLAFLSVLSLSASWVGKECDFPVLWVLGWPYVPSTMPFCQDGLRLLWDCGPKEIKKKNKKQIANKLTKPFLTLLFVRIIFYSNRELTNMDDFHRNNHWSIHTCGYERSQQHVLAKHKIKTPKFQQRSQCPK